MKTSDNFVFDNHGTIFMFRGDQMTQHPFKRRGATMLQAHALITLERSDSNIRLYHSKTRRSLSRDQLLTAVRTGHLNS